MSTIYRVGTDYSGTTVWWQPWKISDKGSMCRNIRNSIPEEAELMDKIIWGTAAPGDAQKLYRLLNPGRETP